MPRPIKTVITPNKAISVFNSIRKKADKAILKAVESFSSVVKDVKGRISPAQRMVLKGIYSDFMILCINSQSYVIDLSSKNMKIHKDFHRAYLKQIDHEALFIFQELALFFECVNVPKSILTKMLKTLVRGTKGISVAIEALGSMCILSRFDYTASGVKRVQSRMELSDKRFSAILGISERSKPKRTVRRKRSKSRR